MRIGTLIKHVQYGFIGVITKHHSQGGLYVVWSDNVWNCWCNENELEVLCE